MSVVTPVYAGEKYLRDLIAEVGQVRDRLEAGDQPWRIHEAVFVCDGPIDDSAQVLAAIQSDPQHAWVQVVHLSQNYGQHPATIAGILHASGDWIATLDEDLQHHPQFIERMLHQAVSNHCDVVYGKPNETVHESGYRDLGSRYYKRFVSMLSGNPDVVHFNSFRLMRGSVARAAAAVATHDTYFDIALGWYTNKVTHIALPLKDERYIKTGKSGYSLYRLISHARRLLANSQVKLLRVGALIGALALVLAFTLMLVFLGVWLFAPESIAVRGWLSTFSAILFFGGLNALLIGFALEHLSIILLKIQGKPSFFVVDRSSDARVLASFEQQTTTHPTADEQPTPAPASA